MADVAADLYDWSTDQSQNSPSGTTIVGSGVDDNLRQIQATVRTYLASYGGVLTAAGTVDLGSNHATSYDISGATTITSLGTVASGIWHELRFTGTPLIKYNGTSNILPSGGDILAAAGDTAKVESLGSGNWLWRYYERADGTALRANPGTTSVSSNTTLSAFNSPVFVLVTATANVTLPAANAVPVGAHLTVKSITTGNVGIVPNGTDQIDAINATVQVPAGDTWELRSNASNGWYVIRRGERAVGDIFVGGYTTAPWYALKCDASAVSRTTYAGLFAKISTSFGTGDGSSTFNVPDTRGRTMFGVGQGLTADGGGSGTSRALGDKFGAEGHTLTTTEMPAHTHTVGVRTSSPSIGSSLAPVGNSNGDNVGNTTITSSSTGSGGSHSIMNPGLGVQFYIQL